MRVRSMTSPPDCEFVSPGVESLVGAASRQPMPGYLRRVSEPARIEEIPLFPLASVVLFPHGRVPLHVFEARYRQLSAHALAGARRIGMVAVRPEHVDAMAGDPPLYSVGCAGVIEEAVRRKDGRYDLVLRGTHRFRIVEEPPREGDRLYRIARTVALDDPFDEAREGILLQGLRADAIDLLSQLLRLTAPDAARALDPRRFSGIDDVHFVDLLCQLLDLAPAEKQGLLETTGTFARCRQLVALLEFLVAEFEGGPAAPSRTLH
jgi:Lon protease-like protein